MTAKTLDAEDFLRLVSGGAANLRENAQTVNDLNVFPIPDGDTGENMSLTIGGGLQAVHAEHTASISDAAQQLADGMLMSARGNSGVILSQLFAGIAAGLRGKQEAQIEDLSNALQTGVEYAYASVATPTEGTILTVAREAAAYAASRIDADSTLESFWTDYLKELSASLQRTPELLAVLKEAGVIDSGGAGLYYIADGIRRTFFGERISAEPLKPAQAQTVSFEKFNENSVMEYGYCTEFLLQLQCSKVDLDVFSVDELIEWLRAVGDSIVAFRTGGVVKVHVHTMTPGTVLNYCQQYGEFLTLKIENMTLQHHDTVIRNAFSETVPQKAFAVVTVASGSGLREALRGLGADVVLDGGQCNNPSTADFIRAFDKTAAKTIFVLPNNGNILLTAKQAAKLYEKADVRVLESKNIGEGYAALSMLSYDSNDADEIEKSLMQAMQGVQTGMLSRAVRDSVCKDVPVQKDDYLAFTDKAVFASEKARVPAALTLLEKMQAGQHEILIAIYGADFPETEQAAFRDTVRAAYPHTELCELSGGQEVYDLIVILE